MMITSYQQTRRILGEASYAMACANERLRQAAEIVAASGSVDAAREQLAFCATVKRAAERLLKDTQKNDYKGANLKCIKTTQPVY